MQWQKKGAFIRHLHEEYVTDLSPPMATYNLHGALDDAEGPKPFLHPLRTIAGHVVTGFRPHDHRWHHGLAMTCASLSGQNFWGGPTFVRDAGYQWLDNVGRQVHRSVDAESIEHHDDTESDGLFIEHGLDWITRAGERWIDETRRVQFNDQPGPSYAIDWTSKLTNVSGHRLEFGSPTTEGRPQAGYGSLFWRGPRDFVGATVRVEDESLADAEAIMGQPSPWLSISSPRDGDVIADQSGQPLSKDPISSLVFCDHPSNPRYPNPWFVRNNSTPVVSFGFQFHEVWPIEPGETLTLHYRVVIADGEVDREQASAWQRAFAEK